MSTNKVLTSFIIENFNDNLTPSLLFNDKKLLKEENYEEFAKEQLKKNKWALSSAAFPVFMGFIKLFNHYLVTLKLEICIYLLLALPFYFLCYQ